MTSNAELVELGDVDELLFRVDRLCASADWLGLVDLRDRARKAVERGHQLWPVAAHIDYRLALEAPGRWAAAVLVADAGRFALGPLPEVAASTHAWEELAPHLPSGPSAGLFAHECVVRGEDLRGDARADGRVLELPLTLADWEPRYPTATYKAHEADFGEPRGWSSVQMTEMPLVAGSSAERISDTESSRALAELVSPWTTGSNGRLASVAVKGDAPGAIAHVSGPESRFAHIALEDALGIMAWTAASGGAHGRRRGMASGRFSAWWVVATLTGLVDRWPVATEELGAAAGRLDWYRWDEGAPESGWVLRLAVEDRSRDRAWAIACTDRREE